MNWLWTGLGWVLLALGVGVVMLAMSRPVRRLMHLDTLRDDRPAVVGGPQGPASRSLPAE